MVTRIWEEYKDLEEHKLGKDFKRTRNLGCHQWIDPAVFCRSKKQTGKKTEAEAKINQKSEKF